MNNYEATAIVWGKVFLNTVLAAFKTVPLAALIVTPKVRLNTNPAFNPTPASVIADFTPDEANYSGYTSGGIALVISAPVNLGPQIQGVVGSVDFIATSATPFVPATAYGYWVDDGTNVILAEKFSGGQSAQFQAAGDFLGLDLRLPLGAYQVTG